jgi:hypothetical protein
MRFPQALAQVFRALHLQSGKTAPGIGQLVLVPVKGYSLPDFNGRGFY